tara:strand:- start:3372 stop:3806 length:435 start_codon:yes stop_codon:yes gene_type:complete
MDASFEIMDLNLKNEFFYDRTDKPRSNSNSSNISEISLYLSDDEVIRAFDSSRSSSLDENSEKSNSGKFKLKRTISVGSLDSGTLKKSNSSNSLFKVRKQTKKNIRRKRDNLIFLNGQLTKEFSRTPTPPMFQELEKMFKFKKN